MLHLHLARAARQAWQGHIGSTLMRAERLRREGQRAWWEPDLLVVTLEEEEGGIPFFVGLRGPRCALEPPSTPLLFMVALAS